MNWHYLNKTGSKTVLVFFNGWGMDSNIVSHIKHGEADVIECNSYHEADSLPFEEIEKHEKKILIAYSMGVWAAANTFKATPDLFDVKIAIAGSLFPVDDSMGIPVSIFSATLNNLSPVSFDKFILRMCGSAEIYKQYNAVRPTRNFADCKKELQYIFDNSKNTNSEFSFDKIIISKNDKIFPWNNLQQAFPNTQQILIDAPHFPFFSWKNWNEIIQLSE